jgi:hypothetical protein
VLAEVTAATISAVNALLARRIISSVVSFASQKTRTPNVISARW